MPDIIVIGGGPGGTAAATRAAQLGAQVTLIERAQLGGNCVNKNCIPLTNLLASVELYRRIGRAAELGVDVGPAKLNAPAMMARSEQILQDLRDGLVNLLPTFNIEVVTGQAKLINATTVEVDGQRLQASRAIILATGAQWAPLPAGVEAVWRPDEAMRIDAVPGRLLIWGGGAADIEFATLYAALGAKVTLAVDGPYPLPQEDYEIGQRLQGFLPGQGIEVLCNVRVTAAVQTPEGLNVTLTGLKGVTTQIVTDRLLWAGRVPVTEGLGLENAGVKLNDGAVVVNDRMQTNVSGLYAIGDLTGAPYYSSLATAGALVAAENAMGKTRRLDRRAVPRYAFSNPEVATVGLTEDEATDKGYDIEIVNIAYSASSRAMGLGETEGGIKLIADRKLGKVLGVHIVGYRATELIAEAALGVQLEALAEDFANAIRIHPTLSESMLEAGRAVLGQALYVPKF
jgi:dihydrolipoamide dehydrogenase